MNLKLLAILAQNDALIKYEATPVEALEALTLKIAQNSAFELSHFRKSLVAQIGRRFFAAHPTGAEHDNFFVFGKLLGHLSEITEASHPGGLGALKGSVADLKIVTRVENQGGFIARHEQFFELSRRNMGSRLGVHVKVLDPHGDDLFFYFDLEPLKGQRAAVAQLKIKFGASDRSQPALELGLKRLIFTGQIEIYPLGGQEDRAHNPHLFKAAHQIEARGPWVLNIEKAVVRDI